MRSTTDNPVDPLGNLGQAIKPAAPAPAPSPAQGFELGNWATTLPDGLAEKPAEPAPADPVVITYHLTDDEAKGCAEAAEFLRNLPEYGGLL